MKKSKIVLVILACLTVLVSESVVKYNEFIPVNRVKCLSSKVISENPIKKMKNYIIYYGNDFKVVINKLKTYNLVIINPLEEGADDALRELHKANVKVYGYFSAVEIPSYDSEYIATISNNEKLKINNRYINHWEDNLLGDITNASFRKKIINLVGKRIFNKYDGVFIDTVDDIDCLEYILDENNIKLNNIDTLKKSQQEGCINFFKELKATYRNMSIIQNRGFELLQKGNYRYIDSILYEDIRKTDDEDYYKSIKKILDKFTSENNGVVMALANDKRFFEESKKLSQSNKWLYYATTSYESTNIKDGSYFILDK
ncbi:MAG: hypothetical protein E7214_09530 [Clostridium sp.]|nr:hypothetical protein [Clostridium sp.]